MRSQLPITDVTAQLEGRPTLMWLADYRDDGVYTVTWPDGHKTTTILQDPKYCVLMEFAVEAFCDRYYREALLTCTSAIDAFLDSFIEVVMLATGSSPDHVSTVMNSISKQAERRLGAFFAVEASLRKVAPFYLAQKLIELRNNVVHKGYIPDEKQVFDYMEAALAFVVPRHFVLAKEYGETTRKLYFDRVGKLPPSEHPQMGHTVLARLTVIDRLAFPQEREPSELAAYVAWLKNRKLVTDLQAATATLAASGTSRLRPNG